MELIGRQFGNIRVTQVVGQGGMGDVYGGYDEKLERKVAIKVLNDDQRLDAEARERLLREARALSKLDHPNICRIHDYIETRDLDLLVLEYIDGKTLDDAMQEGMPHQEKLRIAIAIADVLVQAHRAGIVHRDLKPENVMLTKAGEVKVLDFGLARWLHRKGKSSDRHIAIRSSVRAVAVGDGAETTPFTFTDPSPAARRDFLATAVGITLGTPLFMSPEQARGESLTPASDMFSFGLLQQSLFTGEDPHPVGLTAREVILRVARGETQPVKGAPGDVTALINRLKQFAPADRPTAVEVAERLRFLNAKPQRIARRAIIAALVAIALLGAWRYTVDLRRERAAAEEAREKAEFRRAQAEDLMNFMVGDLRTKLEPVGNLDALDGAAERVLKYVNASRPEEMSADELSRASKALGQLGEVRIAQGKLDDALTTFQRSLEFGERAAKRSPDSAEIQLAVGTAHFWVGDVHRRQADLDQSLRHYTAYLHSAEALARREPENDAYQLERAYGHSSVASIYERRGELPRAIEHLQLTRQIKAARIAAAPGDPARQADLANTLNRIGLVRERSFDLRGAREYYEQEFATYSRLVAMDPRNTRWRERHGISHNFVGHLLEWTGDVQGALEHRRQEMAVTRELHQLDPQNAVWQRNFAIAQMTYANTLRLTGATAAAGVELAKARETMSGLLSRNDPVWSWKRDIASIETAAVRIHLAAGNVAAAKRAAAAAVEILDSLGVAKAGAAYVAAAYLALGDAAGAVGDTAAARDAWSKSAALIAPMTASEQTPQILDTLARALLQLGRRDEAAPLVTRLMSVGYRSPDFVHAASTTQ